MCWLITSFHALFPQISPTGNRINIEKLKVKEKIFFYDEVILYEDELADNGCTKLSIKMVRQTVKEAFLQRNFVS